MDGDGRERFDGRVRARPTARSSSPGRPARASRRRCTRRSHELNDVDKNIITIEDPVEYRIEGINQINVNRKAGLTFATGLRSILRADPDVIMVGEIRDAETARIAIESALTGHMVLSTLHTNDAPGDDHPAGEDGDRDASSPPRRSTASSPSASRASSAPHCKRRTVVAQTALEDAGFRVGADVEVYEPVGCARCNATGYRAGSGSSR